MATELWLSRRMDALVPANAQALESLRKLPADKWLLCELRMPRNVKHHRKFMAVLQAVYPHQDMWPTFNSFRKAFTAALGHGEVVTAKDGRKFIDADSISFATMDQTEFDEFYARAIEFVLTKVLPGVDSRDLEREVADILEGRKAA
jgi:hypothetical protein